MYGVDPDKNTVNKATKLTLSILLFLYHGNKHFKTLNQHKQDNLGILLSTDTILKLTLAFLHQFSHMPALIHTSVWVKYFSTHNE